NPTCDDSYVLYGGQANGHISYTQQDVIDGNAGDWQLLDANDPNNANYNHPAYYSPSNNHDVLDCTQGDSVGDWTLVEPQNNNNEK
ncbi:MAG TPA: hypothetical protein D7I03_02145, partial [Candidatus Poseidoniales archaeon]